MNKYPSRKIPENLSNYSDKQHSKIEIELLSDDIKDEMRKFQISDLLAFQVSRESLRSQFSM